MTTAMASRATRGNGRDMKNLWYVSVASASTAAAPRRMHESPLTPIAPRALLAVTFASLGCSGSVASGHLGGQSAEPPKAIEKAGARDANLAGARCKGGGTCTCRNPAGAAAEAP